MHLLVTTAAVLISGLGLVACGGDDKSKTEGAAADAEQRCLEFAAQAGDDQVRAAAEQACRKAAEAASKAPSTAEALKQTCLDAAKKSPDAEAREAAEQRCERLTNEPGAADPEAPTTNDAAPAAPATGSTGSTGSTGTSSTKAVQKQCLEAAKNVPDKAARELLKQRCKDISELGGSTRARPGPAG